MIVLILVIAAAVFAVAGGFGTMWSVFCASERGIGVSLLLLGTAFFLSLAGLIALALGGVA